MTTTTATATTAATAAERRHRPARVVAFSTLPAVYEAIEAWAGRAGHEIVLVVTVPRSADGTYGTGFTPLPDRIGDDVPVLVTRRPGPDVIAALRAVEPDLVVSGSYPRRITEEVVAVPRYGALNVHPAPLPNGRGPMPTRLLYEGDTTVGATVHRLAPDIDRGAILARAVAPLTDVSPAGLWTTWLRLIGQALDAGAARALAGEWGEEQDEAAARYTGNFTTAEARLDWTLPARLLACRVTALNVMGPQAYAALGDTGDHRVAGLRALPGGTGTGAAGTVVDRAGDVAVVACGDGLVEVDLVPALTARPAPVG